MTQSKKLPFGPNGEITEKTIIEANLTDAEKGRAYEMLDAHDAFLTIMDTLSYPIDPDGHTHDLNHMHPTKIAIAWTLALSGYRKTGPVYIKKRAHPGAGMYADAHTWVDVRAPDTAAEELKPGDNSMDPKLPPDTRRLAAIRDGEEPLYQQQEWHTSPRVVSEFAPRPED